MYFYYIIFIEISFKNAFQRCMDMRIFQKKSSIMGILGSILGPKFGPKIRGHL